MAAVAHPPPVARPSSFLSDSVTPSLGAASLSTLGPSPSERLGSELGHGEGADSATAPLRVVPLSPRASQAADDAAAASADDDDAESVATETRTITRVEDLPADKASAIGTVLEERAPRRVPLLTEFLAAAPGWDAATREMVAELYDADLELSVECHYLPKVDVFSNSDPYAELHVRDGAGGARWRLAGRTETLANTHFPRFVTKFALDARPDQHMERQVRVAVHALATGPFARPPRLGEASCTLWDIVSAPGHCKVMRLVGSPDARKESWVVLTADVSRDRLQRVSPRDVVMFVRFDETARPRSKTHFVVSRALKKGRWTPVYRSEGHGKADRDFKAARLTFADVFAGDERKPCRVELYQRRVGIDAKLAGFVQFSVEQIDAMQEGRPLQWWSGKDATPPGMVVLTKKDIIDDCISVWLTVTNK